VSRISETPQRALEAQSTRPKLDPLSHFGNGLPLSPFPFPCLQRPSPIHAGSCPNTRSFRGERRPCMSSPTLLYRGRALSCCLRLPTPLTHALELLTWKYTATLSILSSIRSDMHECRFAYPPVCMRRTWSAGNQGSISSRQTSGFVSPPITTRAPPEPHYWPDTRHKLCSILCYILT
jgi:hypothetical protein